ncbi:hypothetical protein BCR37DRAFT_413166 [Protomyces lactucae-debilis]|uniref:U3 small nucleolar RNA-associated protein 25 n=1 Tax=Protomyces lactucae-debilis TaxID=2754530 RepID=A0A1Y2FGG2_PROLT|nr:uncharacterized protein BCR37DRAFT_413166 [Protomyces lactucae-debilis]ORY83030.1 hypothetical protein BCR37DRAFT_413166 [Protomyces lactucae-debilis]
MKRDEAEEPRQKKRRLQEPEVDREATPEDEDVVGNEPEAEEEEEAEEAVVEQDDVSPLDPFESHFAAPDAELLEKLVSQVGKAKIQAKMTQTGDCKVYCNEPEEALAKHRINLQKPESLHVKQRLSNIIPKLQLKEATQASFVQQLLCYKDISYSATTHKTLPHLRGACAAHILNHIFKTRDRILKNNGKLAQHRDDELELRDQSFTRPKVLILMPTRNAAFLFVNQLIALAGAESIENRKRFNDNFGAADKDPVKSSTKPEDFKAFFEGNTDDAFRLGIKFTRKTIKLFSQFYASDIIIASPLGLRMVIGDPAQKKVDYDFLSSIELLLLDSCDGLAMQNWEHVAFALEHLNLIPKESHGCDYARVRNWCLEEKSKYLRQTILLSAYEFPEQRQVFQSLVNVAGQVRFRPTYTGKIANVQAKQIFSRLTCDATNPASEPDARYKHFATALLPRIKKLAVTGSAAVSASPEEATSHCAGILLVVPSYFDFLRVRNCLNAEEVSFEAISEYAKSSQLSRSRALFAAGRCQVLVVTERLQFYRRYAYRGAKRVMFYQLPEHADFYTELARSAIETAAVLGNDASDVEVRAVFSHFDALRLERIVGSQRIARMLQSKDASFEFS